MKQRLIITGAVLALVIIGGAGYYGYQASAIQAELPPTPETVPVELGRRDFYRDRARRLGG